MKTEGTPQREPLKRLSAGIVPIRFDNVEPLFLLLRCFQYWDFPKGGVLPGESPLQAALRELEEETTLAKAKFRWGESFFETPPYSHGKTARYYVAEVFQSKVELPINPLVGRAEHQEFRWCTAIEAQALVGPRVAAVLAWAKNKIEIPVSVTQQTNH